MVYVKLCARHSRYSRKCSPLVRSMKFKRSNLYMCPSKTSFSFAHCELINVKPVAIFFFFVDQNWITQKKKPVIHRCTWGLTLTCEWYNHNSIVVSWAVKNIGKYMTFCLWVVLSVTSRCRWIFVSCLSVSGRVTSQIHSQPFSLLIVTT